jgi:hypothetical protein
MKAAAELYTKVGRRYVPFGNAYSWEYDADIMKAGTFRLTCCPGEGSYRYIYDVTPETAGFVAAAQLARGAMENAMQDAAIGKPSESLTMYTPKQRKIIERFRAEMAAAGGLLPTAWVLGGVHEIAQAGVDACRKWKP